MLLTLMLAVACSFGGWQAGRMDEEASTRGREQVLQPVNGQIVEPTFTPGDTVEAGQFLGHLGPDGDAG